MKFEPTKWGWQRPLILTHSQASSGAPQSQLNIGKSIFFNERINTTTSGLVQVLLVDGSTFTVGPGSDLVIDKFVYDQKKGTGQIAASFSKGVMRFVGGKISKNDNAVSIKTPAGAIAVRGCIVMTEVTSSSFAAVLVYGDYLKMKDLVVFEAGNGIFLQNGQMVIKPTPPGVINGMLAGLTNKGGGGFAGGQGNSGNPGPTFQLVTTESMNELISDANTTQIVDQAQNQAVTQETTPTIPEGTAPPCESECEGSPAGHQWGYAGGLYVQNESEVYVQDEGENDYSNEGGDERVGVLSNWKAKRSTSPSTTANSLTLSRKASLLPHSLFTSASPAKPKTEEGPRLTSVVASTHS